MKKMTCILLIACFFCISEKARAITLNKAKTINLSGKFTATNSIRTEDSQGDTYPSVEAGTLVQQRNFLQIMIDIKLVSLPYDWKGKIQLTPQAYYDSIYDYGPDEFQDAQDKNKDEIEEYKQDIDLYEGYLDLSKGSFFMRAGRQNLSWGEIEGMVTILDRQNPMDMSHGLLDPEEMRMPLGMVRGVYDLGDFGSFSSLSVEGYVIPDDRMPKLAPYGSAYYPPLPANDDLLSKEVEPLQPLIDLMTLMDVFNVDLDQINISTPVVTPEDAEDTRMGIKFGGMFSEVGFSLALFQTWSLMPTPIFKPDTTDGQLAGRLPSEVKVEQTYDAFWVAGLGLNYYEPNFDCVFRIEAGWFWDEPMSIPDVNVPMPDIDNMTLLDMMDMEFTEGKMVYGDVFRIGLGIDKIFYMRFLNPTTPFMLVANFASEFYLEYDERMAMPIEDPDTGEYIPLYEDEHFMMGRISTEYKSGKIKPELVAMYDVQGRNLLLLPAVTYVKGNSWRFKLQYQTLLENSKHIMGIVMGDRDQVTLVVSYLFQ